MKDGYIATLVHNRLEEPIIIDSAAPTVFTVENTDEFCFFVNEFLRSGSGESEFVLLRENERLSMDKMCEIVTDVFSVDMGERKEITVLHKELIKAGMENDLILLENAINTHIAEFYSELFEKFSLNLNFDEIDMADLLKISNVRIKEEYDCLLEKLICFINACVALKHKSLFVFVNLKNIISDDGLEQLYKHCNLEKVGLLLIEGRTVKSHISVEHSVTITEDLCERVDNRT